MKPILKYQNHIKILSCVDTLVKELLKPMMEIDSGGNENIHIHILIPIPLVPGPGLPIYLPYLISCLAIAYVGTSA
jgi:hypothetical protein